MDVRRIKTALRKKHKQTRKDFPLAVKSEKDKLIFDRVVSLDEYEKAQMLIIFISTDIEVDTKPMIQKAWDDKKTVVVPRCINQNGLMSFFVINSYDDLEPGSFGILEPDLDKCQKVTNFDNSMCVVPALAFDSEGYRLGYGKGYYDRFLSKYKWSKVGVCYKECMEYQLPHGKYDVSVDMVISDD